MALVNEKGKLRPQPPRLKNIPAAATARERDRNRDSRGRFVGGNRAATGRAWKSIVRRALGRDATAAETDSIYRDAGTLFAAQLRQLPSQVPQVQDAVARGARASVLSSRTAALALEAGLETDAGRKLLELSIKLDARAERLAVTALDLAQRFAKAESAKQLPPALAAIEARAAEALSAGADPSDASEESES